MTRVGQTKNAYEVLVGKVLGNVQLEDRKGDGNIT
jgi:hypothetical protein